MLQVHRDEPGVSGRKSWETGRGEGDTEALRAVVPEGDVLRSWCGTRGQEETEGPEDPVAALSGAWKKVETGGESLCSKFASLHCLSLRRPAVSWVFFFVRSEMWLQ